MKYPKNETVWMTYYDSAGTLQFFMTSKAARDYYYLYAVKDDSTFVKLGKARSPAELEKKYDVDKKIGVMQ